MITTDLHPADEDGGQEFRSRTSETYARIHSDVVSGKLKPGLKLKIEQLREDYDVGATPVREALSFLAADGLVVREDQKGFRVAEVSADEFEDLLAVRCMIEERALRLAISRGGRKWEEGIVLARFRLLGVGRIEGNEAEWERHHRAFHMSLLAACGSNLLLRLSKQFYDENNRYRHLSRLNHATTRDVRGEHEEIAEAVLARDADRAVRLLVEHYTKTGNLLRIALKRLATDGPGGPFAPLPEDGGS